MSEANADDKQFAIQKIYVKDLSFETPNSPAVFTEQWKPEVNLNLNTESHGIAENVYEVVLKLTVTATQGEKTTYLAEVQQAGIFTMAGFSEDEIKPMLGAFCPNTLYPFARETVADLIQRGGFPPLLLAPINFDALYAQQVNEVQAQVTDPTTAGH
ncbi:protein-export protein SecB [Thiohalobacter sp. COW1]|uniref:Protein-export protein SecB n=1 Tax=Thiohalobacter thiocyanaticus TaxID=585455 RepID=A0A1Z4VMV8_9GAMM|nr:MULTISPECIES: protein-export chaperone SecB [Thiohalobacter]BAZ92688.1 protein-export protein SecB [Thiohalobacter thiocyanaticus]BCO32353.1 protein-export protein SecB [Thiohalobacter sp. COW1]